MNASTKVKNLELLYTNTNHPLNSDLIEEEGQTDKSFRIFSIQFNPKNNLIATGDSNGQIRVSLFYCKYIIEFSKFLVLVV